MKYAGFWKRANAYGIDSLVVVLLTAAADFAVPSAGAQTAADIQMLQQMGWLPPADPNAPGLLGLDLGIGWLDLAMPLAISAAYNILFSVTDWQATPGKHWLGMKIVTKAGRKLDIGLATLRHLASGLSMILGGMGYLTMFAHPQKAALHDLMCGTRVILREKAEA